MSIFSEKPASGRGIAARRDRAERFAHRLASRFGREESGSLMSMALFMFILMVMIGGMAVDVMRHEAMRTRLQSTTDRAVLAAASLDQTADPVSVVDDYFAKAGMSDMLVSRDAVTSLGFRHVDAQTAALQNNFFMNMIGVNTLNVAATGAAEERISTIEVSLVLDVSASMGNNNRIGNLRTAGKNFIDLLIGDTTDSDISVSMVPYSGQVNVGASLLSHYNVSTEHSYSGCVEFAATDFDTPALSTAQLLQRESHFDPWYTSTAPQLRFCNTDPELAILPVSNNAGVLKAKMQGLFPDGNTSIDIGVKWAAALLDPGTQPVISALAGAGVVPAEFSDRPHSYNNKQVLKVIVVMSDGENWDQFNIKEPYKSGLSNVWINTVDNKPSILSTTYPGQYYTPHLSSQERWSNIPWGSPVTTETCNWVKRYGRWQHECSTTTTPNTAHRMTYPELWNAFTPRWVASNLYSQANSGSSTTWTNNFIGVTQPSVKDDRLAAVCQAAKDNNVLIFAVGFEAPSNGRAALRNCASSAGHYYDANGSELTDVFGAIARQISQLKLTQ